MKITQQAVCKKTKLNQTFKGLVYNTFLRKQLMKFERLIRFRIQMILFRSILLRKFANILTVKKQIVSLPKLCIDYTYEYLNKIV